MSKNNQHWTAESADAFVHKLAFDFIAQLEEKIEASGLSQSELAKRLGVSKGSVSQVLNNPQNLTLKTIARYARALGIKAAIVAYDDHDPKNEQGLVGSAIFKSCWEQLGCPRDVWSLRSSQRALKATSGAVVVMARGAVASHASNIAKREWNLPVSSNAIYAGEMQGFFSNRTGAWAVAESNNYVFDHTELTEILIKKLDLHEGLWCVYLEFGLMGANIPVPPDSKIHTPAAITLINKIGIQRFSEPSNLTVDAAVVNPRPSLPKKKKVAKQARTAG